MQFIDAFDFNKKTALYIHVPFCKSKCSYCAFYSKPCNHNEIELYYKRLASEILQVNRSMNGRPYYTAFIGGGNPGCLSVNQLSCIAELVCANGRPEEFTVEINPESLTEEHFTLFEYYFTRISMGVQSLNEKALEFLGRNSDIDQTLNGIKLALELRKKLKTQVNFDLITCLPLWHDYRSDVITVVNEFAPDHISLYALTLEEGTPLYKLKPVLPDTDRQFEILSELWALLDSFGYKQYEVSNFAKDCCYSKHNSVYWDYEQYIGLGPAAASTGFNNGKCYRIESPYNVSNYVNNPEFSDYVISELTASESLEELILMGLRHTKGLNLRRLKEEYGKSLTSIPDGFSIVNGFLVPSKQGLLVADWGAEEVLRSIDS